MKKFNIFAASVITLSTLALLFFIGLVFTVIIVDNQNVETLRNEGTTATVEITSKYSRFAKIRSLYLTMTLPNEKSVTLRTDRTNYNDHEIGDSIQVCYHNDIARIDFEECHN